MCRHHCRLCGKLICKNCSRFLSFLSASQSISMLFLFYANPHILSIPHTLSRIASFFEGSWRIQPLPHRCWPPLVKRGNWNHWKRTFRCWNRKERYVRPEPMSFNTVTSYTIHQGGFSCGVASKPLNWWLALQRRAPVSCYPCWKARRWRAEMEEAERMKWV